MTHDESDDARRARKEREREAAARPAPRESRADVAETLLGGSGEELQSGRNSGRGSDETRRSGG